MPRIAVNARVVVVGATETALATVDRLASHPTAAFNNVALVAAGGGLVIQKNGGAGSAAYDAAGVAKLASQDPREWATDDLKARPSPTTARAERAPLAAPRRGDPALLRAVRVAL